MSDFDLIIVGGLVVTATEIGEFDIGIKDEKIADITARGGLSSKSATRTIDAKGGYVMVCGSDSDQYPELIFQIQPGGIDAHVHLDEPPLFGKGSTADNFETGNEAYPGICSIC